MAALPRVVLRKNLARAIGHGHPWIYRDAVTAPADLADGALVFVVTEDRRAVARGFWDARSPIAVRVLATAAEAADVGRDLDAAVATLERVRTLAAPDEAMLQHATVGLAAALLEAGRVGDAGKLAAVVLT